MPGTNNTIIVDYDNGTYNYKKVAYTASQGGLQTWTVTGAAITSGTNPSFTITISSGKITVKSPSQDYNLLGYLFVWE